MGWFGNVWVSEVLKTLGWQLTQKLPDVTRFEVIDYTEGRVCVVYGCEAELSWQDNGRTLKVFVKSVPERYKKK
jgi:hypothetical protein